MADAGKNIPSPSILNTSHAIGILFSILSPFFIDLKFPPTHNDFYSVRATPATSEAVPRPADRQDTVSGM